MVCVGRDEGNWSMTSNLIADVHTLKVLLFALYGWAFAATVLIAILYVRRRNNGTTSIAAFASQFGVARWALAKWIMEEKKAALASMREREKTNEVWRGKAQP
jgi:hypothetical protein